MFIHGRVRLDSDEWSGFEEAVSESAGEIIPQ